jgi:uncharacterized protein
MRISESTLALGLLAAAVLGGSAAHAFELKGTEPEATAPERSLQALPSGPVLPSLPALPDLGVDSKMREMWRGFAQTYKSGDKQAALRQLEGAAEQGDILAQWKLGRMYAEGDGVSQDDFRAFALFSRIANTRGDESRESMHAGVVANAFVALGSYWLAGIPQSAVKANPLQAHKAFHYAATYYGHSEAQYQLARMLLDGVGGRPEPRVAVRWLNLAADKGHIYAQARLGWILVTGEGTARHVPRGLAWLRVASESAKPARDAWVLELHRKAHEQASEEDRRLAGTYAERLMKLGERR